MPFKPSHTYPTKLSLGSLRPVFNSMTNIFQISIEYLHRLSITLKSKPTIKTTDLQNLHLTKYQSKYIWKSLIISTN